MAKSMSAAPRLKIRSRFSATNDVTLFTGDCLNLLKSIPSMSVRLIVTSPPYNIGKSYERRLSLEDYFAEQKLVVAECVRVLMPGGSICWEVGSHMNGHKQIIPLDLVLHPLFVAHDSLRLRNRIVWHFEHGLNCRHRFSGRYETILWYTKGDRYLFDLDAIRVPQKYPGKKSYKGPRPGTYSCHPLGKNPGDVWSFPNVKGNHVEKTIHPCQFPIELPERFVRALTKEGDLVLDPYLGVGTTAVAATMLGRRAAGSDRQKEYIAIARQRIVDAARGRVRYRPFGKPIHVPKENTALTTSPFSRQIESGVGPC